MRSNFQEYRKHYTTDDENKLKRRRPKTRRMIITDPPIGLLWCLLACTSQVIPRLFDRSYDQRQYRYVGLDVCEAFSQTGTALQSMTSNSFRQRNHPCRGREIIDNDGTHGMSSSSTLKPSCKTHLFASVQQMERQLQQEEIKSEYPNRSKPLSVTQSTDKYLHAENSPKTSDSIDAATDEILSTTHIPLGTLTQDDIESITSLMARHAKLKTQSSALQVEKLLRRVVIDRDAGNPIARVTTRMYTMAIDAWAKTGAEGAAERADMIHRGMVEVFGRTGDDDIRPSTVSYNAVINAWSKSSSEGAAMRAESILEEMLADWERSGFDANGDHNDDECTMNADSEEDRKNWYNLEEQSNERCRLAVAKPDVVSFTSVIDAWAKSGRNDASERALSLLKRMEVLHEKHGEKAMKPNVYTYSACINAFARSKDPDAPKHAEKFLKDMKVSYNAGNSDIKPSVSNYNSLINAYGRCKAKGSAIRAVKVLDVMAADGIEPDVMTYNLIVSAWVHSTEVNRTQEAEKYLEIMEKWAIQKNFEIDQAFNEVVEVRVETESSTHQPPSSLPAIRVHLDVECYNIVLIALSRSQLPDAPKRAVMILQRMKRLADEGFETMRPNAKSWNAVLNTVSRVQNPNAVKLVESLLSEMKSDNIKPDLYTFASILHAYQKNTVVGGAERADAIVKQMEELYLDGQLAEAPDVFHYTIVCACWAKCGKLSGASRCAAILRFMEERYKGGQTKCKPNVRTYNAIIDAHARCQDAEGAERLLDTMIQKYTNGDDDVKPDSFTFNAVINAWTRTRRKGSGERAEKVLEKVLRFHTEHDPNVGPDTRSFSRIIDYYALGYEPDAAERAEWLLIGMIKMFTEGKRDVLPNTYCCNSVINAFVKRGDSNAGQRAERIVKYMEDLQHNYDVHSVAPNTSIMNSVIHAWSKSGDSMAGERAEQLLLHMESQYQDGNYELQTNTRTYGLVLASWAKSNNPDKTRRAYNILRLMDKTSKTNSKVQKNVHCFNAIMNAAAFTEGSLDEKLNAFHIASLILEDLVTNDEISAVSSSFGTYLKACGKLSLPRDVVDPCIEKAWNDCKNLGLVNEFVLGQMRLSTSMEQYHRLMGELNHDKGKVKLSDIPTQWKRKILDRTLNDGRGEWYN